MVTAEFFLNNTEYKFADLSRNQPPINFKRQIGLKTGRFPLRSHYYFLIIIFSDAQLTRQATRET